MSGTDEATNLKRAEELKAAANDAFKGAHLAFICSFSLFVNFISGPASFTKSFVLIHQVLKCVALVF